MAKNIFKGFEYLFSKSIDPWFAGAIGVGAALIRIRREETCHRLGLPSDSMVYLIEQERHKFDDSPSNRGRLDDRSWSIGDSREANFLRRDAMRNKPDFNKTLETDSKSGPVAPLLSRHPETGEFVLDPSPPEPVKELSEEEIERRDEEFKRKWKAAQPGVDELLMMFGSRASWLFVRTWTRYWSKPWFWTRWSGGWDTWQAKSAAPSKKDYK